jgi:tetratricopeptide (TPR) repeat protein
MTPARLPVRTLNTFLIAAALILALLLVFRLLGSITLTPTLTLVGVVAALVAALAWLLIGRFIAAALDGLRARLFALPLLLIAVIGLIAALVLLPAPAADAGAPLRTARILVTRFEPPPSPGSFPAAEDWRAGIAAVIDTLPATGLDVQVQAADIVVNSREEALTLSEPYDAALIVWGDAHLGGVDVQYTLAPRPCPGCADAPVSLAECIEQPRFSADTGDERYAYDLLLGVLLYHSGAPEAALSLLNEAVRIAGRDRAGELNLAAALTYRGAALQARGGLNEAISNYTSALAFNSALGCAQALRGSVYASMQMWEQAVSDYNAAAATATEWALRGRGVAFSGQGQIDAALADLNEAARIAPESAAHFSSIGDLYYSEGQFEQAVEYKSRAITLEPNNPRYYTDLGGIYFFSYQDYDAAIEVYTQALYADPRSVTAYQYRALSYYELRLYDAAASDFTNAIAFEPLNTSLYTWRARTYAEAGRFDEALLDLNEAIRLEPNTAAHYSTLGDVYYNMGRYQEAIDSESQAIALDPSNVRNYTDLGGIYLFALNDYDNAIATYSRALGVNAQDALALFYRGRAYFAAGRFAEARADIEAAFRVEPNNADYQAWLDENYQALGLASPSF